jgi:UDP-N-acetylmuramoyl-L-alanyl-D-glutamate--2,6-diaminopimelate ligase
MFLRARRDPRRAESSSGGVSERLVGPSARARGGDSESRRGARLPARPLPDKLDPVGEIAMHDESSRGPHAPPLSALTQGFPHRLAGAPGDPAVAALTLDSRRVAPGTLFAALPGLKADGRAFVAEAVRRGAVAVLGPAPAPADCPVPYVETADPRRATALVAAELAGRPHEKLVLCGVTGTSGKTTTSVLLDAVLGVAHARRGLFGTIVYRGKGGAAAETSAAHTTPEATDLCPMLADLVADGGTAAAMEVSSHALAQDRVAGLRYDVAVFTNLSRDHLDYHRGFEDYFAAKAKLFDLLKPGGKAAINADDVYGRRLLERLPAASVVAFTLEGRSFCRLKVYPETSAEGVTLRCHDLATGSRFLVRSPLLGRPNAENLAAATAAGLALGYAPEAVAAALGGVAAVPGRLERVPNARGVTVLVDYAHKPAALEGVLRATRELTVSGGRLRVVFGCGGDRDRGKRPEMGDVAARLADDVVVTSDNPRSEDPATIVAEIRVGVEAAKKSGARADVAYVLDRRAAIAAALGRAARGDVVVVAGKGHETYQLVGGATLPFDDRAEARAWFAAQDAARDAADAEGAAAAP